MKKPIAVASAAACALVLAACAGSTSTPTTTTTATSTATPSVPATGPMSFFVTSVGSGRGADLGGLAGADAHCQRLATAAGHGGKTWRAYLSAQGTGGPGQPQWTPGTNARDRIGKGPWYNAKGVLIARDVNHLHDGNGITKETALTERGMPVPDRTQRPSEHDILTGSQLDGRNFSPIADMTCKNWTSSGEGTAMVGHFDRGGPTQENWASSWNSSHVSVGCSQEALARTGGSGRFYCFAAN